jgi:hypothetical protein
LSIESSRCGVRVRPNPVPGSPGGQAGFNFFGPLSDVSSLIKDEDNRVMIPINKTRFSHLQENGWSGMSAINSIATQHEREVTADRCFSFGRNWASFLRRLKIYSGANQRQQWARDELAA